MNCWKVQKTLSRFIDNEVSDQEKETIVAHLQICRECQAEFDLLQSQKQLLLSISTPQPPPYILNRALARIQVQRPKPVLPKLLWDTAISLLVIGGIGLGIIIGSNIAQISPQNGEVTLLNTEPSIEQLFTIENE